MDFVALPTALFLGAGAIALFSFLAVTAWSDNRRREREAYYESEIIKKVSEMPAETVVGLLRERDQQTRRRHLENTRMGALAAAAAGIGLLVFLRGVVQEVPVYLVGLIPLLIGVAQFAYSFVPTPKE